MSEIEGTGDSCSDVINDLLLKSKKKQVGDDAMRLYYIINHLQRFFDDKIILFCVPLSYGKPDYQASVTVISDLPGDGHLVF